MSKQPEQGVLYALYDPAVEGHPILMDTEDGTLAIFQTEEDATAATKRHPHTAWAKITWYSSEREPQP